MMLLVSASSACSCSGVSVPNLPRIRGQFGRAHMFQLLLQTDDGGNHFARLQPRHHPFHFFADDGFGLLGRLSAPFQIGRDYFLQIVNVVEKNVVQLVDAGLDVARHRDIDQEHRPILRASITCFMSSRTGCSAALRSTR